MRGAPAAISRRGLLRGGSVPRHEPVRIAAGCLAARGVLCRSCGDACPEGAIAFPPVLGQVARPMVDAGRCTACGDCVEACPVAALALAPTAAAAGHADAG